MNPSLFLTLVREAMKVERASLVAIRPARICALTACSPLEARLALDLLVQQGYAKRRNDGRYYLISNEVKAS